MMLTFQAFTLPRHATIRLEAAQTAQTAQTVQNVSTSSDSPAWPFLALEP
jgi:hypothetical protein